jgi:glycosyltransferase involved in cell wall biosynthesis
VPIQSKKCNETVPWFAPRMRVLVVTNLYPSKERPALGPFVRDQVEAFRRRADLEVELFAFPPGPRALLGATARLRQRFKGQRFDIVHAHFGLTAWPALLSRLGPVVVTLHGNDLLVRRSYLVTRAALPFCALTAAVSREFSENLPDRATKRVAILPVGIDLHRFRPIERRQARERLGLNPDGRYLLFPHDPSRPLKRFDRAQQVAGDTELKTLGGVPPDEVPYWINAANAVLVPSEKEAFGLSAIEALACGVPVLATPVGIHPVALEGVDGAHCAPFDRDAWRAALQPYLDAPDPRSHGRARAELFSADAMAERVVAAWRDLLEDRTS